jgi:putative endonuclease
VLLSSFTKIYNATILFYYEEFDQYRDAFKREKQLKNWHKDCKLKFIKLSNPELKDLYLSLSMLKMRY